jgi:ADP-heptose:LPS heptosyltransferase
MGDPFLQEDSVRDNSRAMNIDTQRRLDRFFGKPVCRFFSLLSSREPQKLPSGRPAKILVILLSEMGSLVLAKPMFDRLAKKYPDCELHALCFARNKEFLEILNLVPSENVFTVRNESFFGLAMDTVRLFFRLRKKKIDVVLDCELFSRISSIYAFLSGASYLVGFHPYTQEGLYRGSFINRPVLYNPYLHISQQFINLVEAIDSHQVPRVKRPGEGTDFQVPQIVVSDSEKEALMRRLQLDFPQVSGKKLVLLYPSGGLLRIRAWPIENFRLVARDLLGRGFAVGVIGTAGDKSLAEDIKAHAQSEICVDLTGYTETVRELMVLFHLSSLLITNDGGPGHFASLTPMPAIVLYGPETPVLYGTLGKKSVHCYASLSCSPCLTAYNHRNSPCDGDNLCLKSIKPDEVLDKAYLLLGQRYDSVEGNVRSDVHDR